ncbi:MAG: Cell division protein FtsL [bacterium]|nr:Cell division protein FtsL [bacterium]
MNKRISKVSPPANKTMAALIKSAPAPAAPSKANSSSSARKPKAARQAAPKPELNSAAIKRSLILLLPFSFFLFFGLFLIWERVSVNELAAGISQLEAQRLQLTEQNGKLRIQLEQLSGYGRIARIATQRLGLVAVPQQTILIDEE